MDRDYHFYKKEKLFCQKVIIQYVLDLDIRGLPPWIANVAATADNILGQALQVARADQEEAGHGHPSQRPNDAHLLLSRLTFGASPQDLIQNRSPTLPLTPPGSLKQSNSRPG
ncbi:hypothetical protein PoMZ_07123 [Pyricularia oryzae]|uniref:Uncharacterized protein n=1 Tax=Pyricularia oryzae TaxID=318829 RepID=A0A4P7NEC7_PYROR|nr:hypothetical protein PoMZ_07123 [Pyricularia oryzae]